VHYTLSTNQNHPLFSPLHSYPPLPHPLLTRPVHYTLSTIMERVDTHTHLDNVNRTRRIPFNKAFPKQLQNHALAPSSRSSSVSTSASSSMSDLRSNSDIQSAPASRSSSILSTDNRFANMDISRGYDVDVDTENDIDLAFDPNARRKSSRIARKRRLGHCAVYADAPPKKKHRKNPSLTKRPTTKSPLSIQNARLRSVRKALLAKRRAWLQYHFASFEPFLSGRARRKLRPSADAKPEIIDVAALPSQPALLDARYTLRSYQLFSVNWLRGLRANGVPAILADEMGLGKTIQSIAAIAAYLGDTPSAEHGPSLMIVPLSVAEAWLTECRKWLPSQRVVLFHGAKKERELIKKRKLQFGAFDLVVTTYEMAVNKDSMALLRRFEWAYLILDEAHRIKNEKTRWYAAMRCLHARSLHTLLLTGTPLQNNMHELWALLAFMFGAEVFDDEAADIFDSAYNQSGAHNEHDAALLSKTAHLIRPFLLRRLKSDVEHSVPPKEEIIIKLKMSAAQRVYYKTYLASYAALLDEAAQAMAAMHNGNRAAAKATVSQYKKLRNLFLNLRQIALHPFLMENLRAQGKAALCSVGELVSHSSKLQLLDALLPRLQSEGHRVLLFSCFTMVLDVLEIYCRHRAIRYLRLDGSTSRLRRKVDIARFNDDPNSPFFLYLISNRAGGLGINLQSADTVIHFDTDWNPQSDLQAQARAHRIGQTRMVKIYRLISKDTVEERILLRSQQKLYLDAVVNEGAKRLNDAAAAADASTTLDLNDDDLLSTITFGADKLFDDDGDGDADQIDLDVLLDRSYKIKDSTADDAEGKASRKAMLRDLSASNNARDFNFSAKLKESREFEGRRYEKAELDESQMTTIAATTETSTSTSRRKRKTKTHTFVVDGLRFESAVEDEPLLRFYEQCSAHIYEERKKKCFAHESARCWGCDEEFAEGGDDEVIACHECPKVFHARGGCWKGDWHGTTGVPICSQHRCFECGAKPAECGMVFRCCGCQRSFCVDCAPAPHWTCDDADGDGDGLFYLDTENCAVAEHFGFRLPPNSYMNVLCSAQCKAWYDAEYTKRARPDLRVAAEALPTALRRRIAQKTAPRALREFEVDARVRTAFMPKMAMRRMRQNLDADCPLIRALYHILFFADDDDGDDGDDDDLKEGVLGKHYALIDELRECAERELTAPQWRQCAECRAWRVVAVPIAEVLSPSADAIAKWQRCADDKALGADGGCAAKQSKPSKAHFCALELAVLKRQRALMAKGADGRNGDVDGGVDAELRRRVNALRDCGIGSVSAYRPRHAVDARWKGIGAWRGVGAGADEKAHCAMFEHLMRSLREWRMEALKTLADHLGFVVVSKQRLKGRPGEFHCDFISASYEKEKVLRRMAAFLVCPRREALECTTAEFSKKK